MRESFIFYKSFFDGVKNLPEENQIKVYQAILNYALDEKDISEELNAIEKTAFILIKPQIDANNKRYEDGKKGGRPKNENKKTSGYENEKPVVFENEENKKPNVNVNENENVNVNDNENVEVEEEVKEGPTSATSKLIPDLSLFYGEYCNVYLEKEDYNKALAVCQDKKMLDELIDEVSKAIEIGKYNTFDETRPHAHLALIKAFHKQKRLNPNKFQKAPPESLESRINKLVAQNRKRLETERLNE